MNTTMELFERALETKRAAEWARDLNITRAALSMAKKANRLSPALAGNIAIELGEDAQRWIAIAAIEAERDSPLLERLQRSQALWRKR